MPLSFVYFPRPPVSTLFPTRRSSDLPPPLCDGVFAASERFERLRADCEHLGQLLCYVLIGGCVSRTGARQRVIRKAEHRSEEHTSELQSLRHLVCRLLLEKKNIKYKK